MLLIAEDSVHWQAVILAMLNMQLIYYCQLQSTFSISIRSLWHSNGRVQQTKEPNLGYHSPVRCYNEVASVQYDIFKWSYVMRF
jgi:hypothetical protein